MGSESHAQLAAWPAGATSTAGTDTPLVQSAGIGGGMAAFKLTAWGPAVMAALCLLLILYVKSTGGCKAVDIETVELPGTGES